MLGYGDKPVYSTGRDRGYGYGNEDLGYGSGDCSYDRGRDSDDGEGTQRIRKLWDWVMEFDNEASWKVELLV